MADIAREILAVNLEDEMRRSYLDYAMSVIVGRALPDVRDGLKPVHRRVLYAMRELGNDYNKAYKKSARVVGDVIGKYHPHGDTAVYDTMVRMAQGFSMRYVLVDGQGNFGSVDGDMPAAMRYTEVRMSRMAHELLADIDKETVDFVPNYDESESEPAVLPTRIPNLLINGSTGIAVGMATNIPPHNLTEVVNACVALIDDPSMSLAALMQHIPGPDFPTAGIINGAQEIVAGYKTGRGRLSVRARTHIEDLERGGRHAIVVTELPYQVNKARLIERIAELVKDKHLDGILTGCATSPTRMACAWSSSSRRARCPTSCSTTCMHRRRWKRCSASTWLHWSTASRGSCRSRSCSRRSCATGARWSRDARFSICARRASAPTSSRAWPWRSPTSTQSSRRSSVRPSPPEARAALVSRNWESGVVAEMLKRAGDIHTRPDGISSELGLLDGGYRLSEVQAQAILDMRLHRLTGLEQDKIVADYQELLTQIRDLGDILARPERLLAVIRGELIELRDSYGDARRTEIIRDHSDLTIEDLIEPQDVVVTLSHSGYAKSQPVSDYQAQRRGGRGKAATSVKDEDFIDKLFVANTHDTLLCFSSRGKVYWLKVYELPQAGRGARGKPMVNLLPLQEGERINAVLPIREYDEHHYVFMATALGTVKKTPLAAFSRPRSTGIIAVDLAADDQLVGVALTDGQREIMLCTSGGKAIRFSEDEVRPMGREAAGVRGVKLSLGQRVIALIVVDDGFISDRIGKRLRQAHAGGRVPTSWSWRPGRHRLADHRAQRPDGRRTACRARPRDHADQLDGHTGANASGRDLGRGPQHAGRAPHSPRRSRAAGRPGARRRFEWRRRRRHRHRRPGR